MGTLVLVVFAPDTVAEEDVELDTPAEVDTFLGLGCDEFVVKVDELDAVGVDVVDAADAAAAAVAAAGTAAAA